MLLTLTFVGLAAQFVSKCESCADPYIPKGRGSAVVAEVVNKINNLGIFPKDHKFLCRVAWVESNTDRHVVPTGVFIMVEFGR